MSSKAERAAARAVVANYHEAQLSKLLAHVAEALESHRRGEIDVFAVDSAIHRYGKAARALWKFCWLGGSGAHLEMVARSLERWSTTGEQLDWWSEVKAERP
jgi:hypothetical protein